MNESKISVRYAKALFLLGKENNMLETLKSDIVLVHNACNEMSDLWLMLESPIVKTSQKALLIKKIFEGKINDICLKFLDLVVKGKREVFLKNICRNFLSLCKKDLGIKSACISSAVKLSEAEKEQIFILLKKEFKAEIELEEKIDPDIIGGFVLRVEDKLLDVSISNQLKEIRRTMLNSNN